MNNAIKCFESMGFKVLARANKTANGPDLHIERNGVIFRVEVKKARSVKRSMSVHPIEKNRKGDDLVAVEFPSGYVLVEPMNDYLKNCAPSGSRSFFGIY